MRGRDISGGKNEYICISAHTPEKPREKDIRHVFLCKQKGREQSVAAAFPISKTEDNSPISRGLFIADFSNESSKEKAITNEETVMQEAPAVLIEAVKSKFCPAI